MSENYIVFRFEVQPLHSEVELRGLLEVLERRGGKHTHRGDGVYELQVPTSITWLPFYRTLKDARPIRCIELVRSVSEGDTPVTPLEPGG